MTRLLKASMLTAALVVSACSGTPPSTSTTPAASARIDTIVLVTIDTLRADRLGAYGWTAGRTPAFDALAARGVRFDRAYATAPITLTSHASLMTGLAPPRHGARHNGMRLRTASPTLAERLKASGWTTGAFVAAFPLDRRFGLDRGFDVYSDTLPRGADGRPLNERSGAVVVDEALGFLRTRPPGRPLLLWVHLFEPHAPYESGPLPFAAAEARGGVLPPVSQRYDHEIARADAEVQRLVTALEPQRASTLFIVTSDHGEAFGDHGEIGHSVFVYDTTLRVPLVITGPGVRSQSANATIGDAVSLVDVMPTLLDLVGLNATDIDGVSMRPLLEGRALAPRALYAESFAPLLDFGWSPLRTLREGDRKYIAAPKPELYDLAADAGETRNLVADRADEAKTLAARVEALSPSTLTPGDAPASGDRGRLQSLGYLAGAATARPAGRAPIDPKDRLDTAARIGTITSGELRGPALRAALESLVRDEPRNGQMQMRLGFVLIEAGECARALPHFDAAIAASVPSAEPHLGRAECLAAAGQRDASARALAAADRVEPGNPVVLANLGVLALDEGRDADAIARLRDALTRAPDLHQARFALARAYGRTGQRADAVREARTLLDRLPPDAPQRIEVERLLKAVQ
jgi:choline-sulfatase